MTLIAAPVRVAVVDRHELVPVALARELDTVDDLEFAGWATTVGVLLTAGVQADIVLLDIDIPSVDGPRSDATRLTVAGFRVVGWSSGHHAYREREIAAVEGTYLLHKSEPLHVLATALVDIARGLTPIITMPLAVTYADEARLSPQEARVLALFASGSKLRLVAYETGLAYSTVEDYVRRIRAKYNRVGRPAVTKIDLLKRAIEDGYLPLPSRIDSGSSTPQ